MRTTPPMPYKTKEELRRCMCLWVIVVFCVIPSLSLSPLPRPKNTAATSFNLIVSSDPQLPWWDNITSDVWPDPSQTSGPNNAEIFPYGEGNIANQYTSMIRLRDSGKLPGIGDLMGVVVNGDLTAYGHDDKDNAQMSQYQALVKTLLTDSGVTTYLGLGNHDYENNVPPHGSCANFGCSTQMVKYMYDVATQYPGVNFDFNISHRYYEFPEYRQNYTGSLAYSINIGPLHVIQLQNFPMYEATWSSLEYTKDQREYFNITSSMQWLAADLAANQNPYVMVNMHDYGSWDTTEFDELVSKFKVDVVFAGHLHWVAGFCGTIGSWGVPFFRIGSSSWLDYLVANFNFADNLLTVTQVINDKCGNFNITSNVCTCQMGVMHPTCHGVCSNSRGAVSTQCVGGGSATEYFTSKAVIN